MRWKTAFLLDWLVILLAFKLLWLPLAVLVIGTRIHAIAILAHDGAHWNASEFMAKLAFGLIGVNLKKYRKFHFEHHAKLGTYEDPELRVHTPNWDAFSWKCLLKDLSGLSAIEMMRIWRFAGGEYWRMGLTLAVFAIVSPVFAVAWMMAIGTSFMACFRLRAVIEHGHAFRITPLMELVLFPHNCRYHAEHHANPSIPFHKLS